MTQDDWKKIPAGTPVRIKAKSGGSYLNTKTKRSAYSLSSGTVVVKVEGHPDPVPVRDIEVIPQQVQGDPAGAQQASPAQSPYPGWSGP